MTPPEISDRQASILRQWRAVWGARSTEANQKTLSNMVCGRPLHDEHDEADREFAAVVLEVLAT